MARMVCKQIYIDARHERTLKRLSRQLKLSEALDVQAGQFLIRPVSDPAAWDEIRAFIRTLKRRQHQASSGRDWTRDDLYRERTDRLD
jgi:hypothetical protein